MFPTFGYRLIPGIRNLGSLRLYVITPSEEYRPLDALIAGRARMDVIEQRWDEVLRLSSSVSLRAFTRPISTACASSPNPFVSVLRKTGS